MVTSVGEFPLRDEIFLDEDVKPLRSHTRLHCVKPGSLCLSSTLVTAQTAKYNKR